MSAPLSHDPLTVTLKDNSVWRRRAVTDTGLGLYAVEGSCQCPEYLLVSLAELAVHGIQGMAHALPMPVGPQPRPSGGFPPALPWARLMDDEDLADFLDELAAAAITHASNARALSEVESVIARWRLIAEAQHGHNTAPGPDAMSQAFAPVATYREDPHDSPLHHDYRIPHDLPLGCGLTDAQVEQLGNPFLDGGA